MSSSYGVQQGALLKALPDACAIVRDSGEILGTNSAWDALWAEHSDVARKNYNDLVSRVRERCPDFAKAIDESSSALTWCDLAHPEKHFEVTYSRIDSDSILITYKDFTEQTRALRELEVMRKKLHSILQSESECIKTMSPSGEILEMNAVGFKLLRAGPGSDVIGKSTWQGRIHPDDREWVINSILKAINSTSPRWEAEYRFKKAGGEYALVVKNVTLVESCARRGAQMVAQLLAFARGTEGRRIPLSLTSLLNDVLRITRETFPKSISVRAHVASDLMPVEGDSSQLHQVLMNLCVNARDAMPSGGVLEIRAENLDVDEVYAGMTHEAHAGNYVRIEIKDNGTGMKPDVLEHLFEPFFTTKEVGKGTGLGLSTTHSIVKGHGGFVRVYSELGEGSTFHVYLPALLDTLSEVSEPFAPAELIPKGSGELILVVDDEPDIRLMVERTLQHFGYQVLLAEHGAEAVSVYANHLGKVSLVITDMAMPIMDGPSTIAALRAMDPNVKIIGSSGFANRAASSSD